MFVHCIVDIKGVIKSDAILDLETGEAALFSSSWKLKEIAQRLNRGDVACQSELVWEKIDDQQVDKIRRQFTGTTNS